MEVRILLSDALELVAIINAVLVAGAEDQPIFAAAIAFGFLKQPLNHAADGCDAGAGSDE